MKTDQEMRQQLIDYLRDRMEVLRQEANRIFVSSSNAAGRTAFNMLMAERSKLHDCLTWFERMPIPA